MPDIDCLVFSPHPDDAELFCGGLLLKLKKQGYTTAIVDLTQGELSTNGTPEIRSAETVKASEILKLDVRENLNISDGNIEDSSENQIKIIKVIRKFRPVICLIPYWRDRHPDHESAARLLKSAIFSAGLNKIDTNQDAFRPATILNYMLHYNFEPSFVIDISNEIEKKIEAVLAYQSQFVSINNNTQNTYINRPDFLESLKVRAAYFGQRAGVSYAEAFYYDGSIKIDNILAHFA